MEENRPKTSVLFLAGVCPRFCNKVVHETIEMVLDGDVSDRQLDRLAAAAAKGWTA